MGKVYDRIDERLHRFIDEQPVFFVATAPISGSGRVNLSPKGRAGSPAVVDEHTLAYLDFSGSHAETLAHLRENGRITLMWCAFTGPPTVVRVHGRGRPVFRDDPGFAESAAAFSGADAPGAAPWSWSTPSGSATAAVSRSR
ncbi:pyridoxamine 5'-phosphate oxidase family protein [Streptomonospora salina]|uniref:Putative pyridoxine 5'-phosphate oxidase superfamily flavin-nucleotide-binding protein n=1 Tax=Streptomonospora salina TaxID=104205 RepID=A0A841E631_9ACTN|nr:pyridoxamine 5'-phosphate oxidase family protein [Streptomonospora salina]MBB5996638.1 putative pyridoxine 5'-phosphate oxidase superfamily flavin-nucleotide-binding protein [Streptomonospora salina]